MRLLEAFQRCGSRSQAAREVNISEDTADRYFASLREGRPFLFDIPEEQRHRPSGKQIVPGYVYLFKADRYYKIGKAINVQKRARQLNLPFEVEILHAIPVSDMDYAETRLHRLFANQRIRREWFDLTENDIRYICSLSNLEDTPLLSSIQQGLDAIAAGDFITHEQMEAELDRIDAELGIQQ